MVYRNWVSASKSETGIEAHSSPVSSVSHTMDSASFDSGLDTGANLSRSMQTSPSLSTTLQSQSSLGSRPPTFPSTPRTATGEAMPFKPISDASKVESSTSFQSDASDSFVSQPFDTFVKSTRWSAHLQEPVDSYQVKSASDTHLHGSSSFMKKLQGQGQSSGSDKVTTPRSRLEPPWSLSDHDRPAKTSTPRGRGLSRPGGAELSPGSSRRAFSLSPDKGRKSYQPLPLQSLSPSLPLSFSTSVHGRGAASSVLVAVPSAGGGGHDIVDSRLVGGGAERAVLLLTTLN